MSCKFFVEFVNNLIFGGTIPLLPFIQLAFAVVPFGHLFFLFFEDEFKTSTEGVVAAVLLLVAGEEVGATAAVLLPVKRVGQCNYTLYKLYSILRNFIFSTQ